MRLYEFSYAHIKDDDLRAFVTYWNDHGIELWVSEHIEYWVLSKIIVNKNERGQGKGSLVVSELCKMADQKGKTIFLTPSKDFGATSIIRLEKFYRKFGFKSNNGRFKDYRARELMVRQPK
jgi:predicted GNAT family N-acyltransferase